MDKENLDEALMKAVEYLDVEEVHACLRSGANPNYVRDYKSADILHQPTTPLRMVVFRISDSLLEDKDLRQLGEIAKLLIQYGADVEPARQLARLRYGEFNPNAAPNPFIDVLRVIEQAT
jgi:hypothetical protein